MTWDAIGAIGEILGAIAVVGSLVYVGRQFRHSSTYALEALYFQTANNFSATRENASVIRRGNADFAELDEDDQQHYMLLMHNLFSALEAIYVQNRDGLANREFTARGMRVAYFYYSQPGFRTAWDHLLREYYSKDFISALESGNLEKPHQDKTNLILKHEEQNGAG